jgi:predicted nucleotidyltransferase
MTEQELLPFLLFKCQVGSYLYGCSIDTSDTDYMGVFVPPLDYTFGFQHIEHVECRTNPSSSGRKNIQEDKDCIYFTLPKFIFLCMNASPTLLELFFVKEFEYCNEYGRLLLQNRSLFLSKKIKQTFLGYVKSQQEQLFKGDAMLNYYYNPKVAYHIVRLLEECYQLLHYQYINFPLKNAAELRKIRLGMLSLNNLTDIIDNYMTTINTVETYLPDEPDKKNLQDLQKRIMWDYAVKEMDI